MNKQQFEQQKRLLWVYMRNEGKCAICGRGVDLREVATDREVTAGMGIDHLLMVQLVHPFCRTAATRRPGQRAA